MTDIAHNLKSNFSAILILGGIGIGAGLLLKKDPKKYGLIGAGLGAAVAALNIKVPGVTHVGFDLFAHGVPAGGDCRPGWCPGDQPHRPVAQRGGGGGGGGGRHQLSPRELEEHRRRTMGGGGRGFEHHTRHHVPPMPMDAGGDDDDDQMPFEPPPQHHHHHHHPHQWW